MLKRCLRLLRTQQRLLYIVSVLVIAKIMVLPFKLYMIYGHMVTDSCFMNISSMVL